MLGEPGKLKQWNSIRTGVASAIVEVECLRTLDRLRLASGLSDEEIASRREVIYRLMEPMQIVELDRTVLARASQPFSTALRTLDAIHLASALLWREHEGHEIAMATHDAALATAARSNGLRVVGV